MLVRADGQQATDEDLERMRASDPLKLFDEIEKEEATPGFGELVAPTLREGSSIASAIGSHTTGVDTTIDRDWVSKIPDLVGTKYEAHLDRFDNVGNQKHFDAMKAQLDMELRDREIIDRGGALGVAMGMGAALFDWTILLPAGTIARGVAGGVKVGRSAANTAIATAGAETLTELGLHATQELRTPEESFINIGASTLLGGMLGAGASKLLSRAEFDAMAGKMMNEAADLQSGKALSPEDIHAATEQVYEAGSLGAAASGLPPDKIQFAGRVQNFLAKAQPWLPSMRLMTSQTPGIRELTTDFIDVPVLRTSRAEEGAFSAPQSIEGDMKVMIDGGGVRTLAEGYDIFKEARKTGFDMNYDEFKKAVTHAMRVGDADPDGRAAVTRVAKLYRKRMTKMFDEMKATGALPEDITTPQGAISYISRLWDPQKVSARRPELRERLRPNIMRATRALESRGEASFVSEADLEDYVTEVLDSIIDKLEGSAYDPSMFNQLRVATKRKGPLEERTLNIDDIDFEDFFNNDIDEIMMRYFQISAYNVAFHRKFGTTDLKEIMEPARLSRDKRRKEIERTIKDKKKQGKALRKLAKEYRKNETDLEKLQARLAGTNYLKERLSPGNAAVEAINAGAYMTMGGMFALSAIPEAGALLLRDMVRPFVPDRGFMKLARDVGNIKMSKTEFRTAGIALEMVRDRKMASFIGADNVFDEGNPMRKFIRNAGRMFAKYSGLTPLTAIQKSVAATSTQQRMLTLARQARHRGFGSLSKEDQTWMAHLGFGRGDAEKLGQTFRDFGEELENGGLMPHTEKWEASGDAGADTARRFRIAMRKSVDEIIITPGAGDTPLFADHPIGRLLFLFTSFFMSAINRLAMNATASSKYGMISGVIAMTGLGAVADALKEKAKGNELSDNPGFWATRAIEASGLPGIFGVMHSNLERMFGIGLTNPAMAMFPDRSQRAPGSRFAGRQDVAGAVGGPGLAYAERGRRALTGDAKSAVRLLPGNNIPIFGNAMRSILLEE